MFDWLIKNTGLTFGIIPFNNKWGEKNPEYEEPVCKSGHTVKKGVRLFKVSGKALAKERWGIYCEACVITARKMAERKKKARMSREDELAEIIKLGRS
jgi:hypothetical protein